VTEVVATDEFAEWYEALDLKDKTAVNRSVGMLEQDGVTLGFPHSSAIEGTRVALRELRVQSQGKPLRIFYAFDPARDAVLLIGGDKTGDARFYERLVQAAERILAEYLKENFGRGGERLAR
jgi:hypothetical protein